MAEETEAQKKARESKEVLKKDAKKTNDFGALLAGKIPKTNGGMSIEEFKDKWIPGFESGHIAKTPETTDTPYDLLTANRPKVRILGTSTTTPK